MQNITVKLDVMKIDKTKLFEGKNGAKYLDAIIMLKDEPDQYGNNGMIVQSISKEEREQGVRGAILGNVKFLQSKPAQSNTKPTILPSQHPVDDLPF